MANETDETQKVNWEPTWHDKLILFLEINWLTVFFAILNFALAIYFLATKRIVWFIISLAIAIALSIFCYQNYKRIMLPPAETAGGKP
jgi:uncharacterized membrane protein